MTDLDDTSPDSESDPTGIFTLENVRPDASSELTPEERVTRAVSALEAAVEAKVASDRVGKLHHECGRVFELWAGDLELARKQYALAHELLPGHLPTITGLRRTLVGLRQHEASLPLFDAEAAAVNRPQRRALVFHDKGRAVQQCSDDGDRALACFTRACELSPGQPRYLQAKLVAELSAGEWKAADSTYEQRLQAAGDDTALQSALLARRARLAAVRFDDPDAAIDHYQAALAIDENAPESLLALSELLEATERWSDLVGVLRRLSVVGPDPVSQALPLQRMAWVLIDQLDQPREGIDALLGAVDLMPDDRVLLEELVDACHQAEEHGSLVNALERLADACSEPGEQAELLFQIGQVCDTRLEDTKGAVSAYRQACDALADHLPAQDALRIALERREAWSELAAALETEGKAASAPEAQAAAYADAAFILERRLQDQPEAVRLHQRAQGAVPTHEASVRALARLLDELGRYDELADVYAAAAAGSDDAELKVTYLQRLGQVQELSLNLPDRALETYQQVCASDARDLERLHGLQRAAERTEQWQQLIGALEQEAQGAPGRAGDLLSRVGQILEQELAQPEPAVKMYRRAAEAAPEDRQLLRRLRLLLKREEQIEALRDSYQGELEGCQDPKRHAEVHYRLAQLCDGAVDQPDEARKHFRAAARGGLSPARLELQRVLTRDQQWDDLVEVFRGQIAEAATDADRAGFEAQVGAVYERRLGQIGAALSAYGRALKGDRNCHTARAGWERCLRRMKDWEKLAAHWAEVGDRAKSNRAISRARYREGEIHRDRGRDAQRAIECFEAVLDRNPGHIGALEALEALYQTEQQPVDLARVLIQQIKAIQDPPNRVAAMHRVLEVAGAAGIDADKTPQINAVLLETAPDDLGALLRFETLCVLKADPEMLSALASRMAEVEEHQTLAATYLVWLAESVEGSDPVGARARFRKALKLDPESFAAIDGLGRLAQLVTDPNLIQEAAELHERAGSPVIAAELFAQRAELAADEAAPDLAATLARALTSNPGDAAASKLLADALLKAESVGDLFEEVQNNLGGEPDQHAAIWESVAAQLDINPERAATVLDLALDRVPTSTLLLRRNAWLHEQMGNHEQAAERLAQFVEHCPASDRTAGRLKLAALYDDHLDRASDAGELLDAVVADDGASDKAKSVALHRLLPLRRKLGEVARAAAVAAQLVSSAESPDERITSLLVLGELRWENREQSLAVAAYAKAVELQGATAEAAERLVGLLTDHAEEVPQGWHDYVAALNRYATTREDPEDALGAILESARVLSEHVKQPAEACRIIQRALDRHPDHPDLLLALAEHLAADQQLDEALQSYRKHLEGDQSDPTIWRSLSRALHSAGRARAAALALAPLVVFRLASKEEQARVAEGATWSAPEATLDEAQLRERAPTEPGPNGVERVLTGLSEYLPKLFPGKLREHGILPEHRIRADSRNRARPIVDQMEAALGLPKFQLYQARDQTRGVRVWYTNPLSLVIPRDFADLPTSQQAFLLAKPMVLVARRLHAVDRLSAEQIQELAASTTLAADGLTELTYADEHRQATQLRRFAAPDTLATIREAATELAAGTDPDRITEWMRQIHANTLQIALVMSNDLVGSLSVLDRVEGPDHGLSQHELLRFWMSETAFRLREGQ